ncbi:MAG: hypothetical protein A2Y38_05605 [Spirochaetes bacterium GWB1_59_5]|nr:MAG: hypothetical protein A2Y38_05605 [Spirochaetes bacterium GWB1_59_5]
MAGRSGKLDRRDILFIMRGLTEINLLWHGLQQPLKGIDQRLPGIAFAKLHDRFLPVHKVQRSHRHLLEYRQQLAFANQTISERDMLGMTGIRCALVFGLGKYGTFCLQSRVFNFERSKPRLVCIRHGLSFG